MTAILQEDAPDLPGSVPGGVREVVLHCLEKNAANRFQSARDLGFPLHALSQGDSQGEAIAPAAPGAIDSADIALLLALNSRIISSARPFHSELQAHTVLPLQAYRCLYLLGI